MLFDTIDLDTGGINSGGGADISYQPDIDQELYLDPLGGMVLALFGPSQPTLANCQAAALEASPLMLRDKGLQYVCYRTNQGMYGYLYLQNYRSQNDALTIQFLTWAAP